MTTPPSMEAMHEADNTVGHVATVCGAQRRQSEGTCRHPAGWGTDHPGFGRCKMHGGSTPTHRASAALVATDAEARAMLDRLGQPQPLGDPVEELLALGAEVRAWQGILREMVAQYRKLSTTDMVNVERERAAVVLYERSLDRSHRVLTDLAKLGLDERRTRVSERQGSLVVQVLLAAVARSGVPVEWHEPLRQALVVELQSLPA